MDENVESSGQPGEEKVYSLKDHETFVKKEFDSIAIKLKDLAGKGLFMTGSIFALVGIADFVSGGKVSEALSSVSPEHVPEIVALAAKHLANMPLLLKTGGGASMITAGSYLERKGDSG